MPHLRFAHVVLLPLFLDVATAQQPVAAPSPKEIEAAVARYVALDERVPAQRDEQLAILARLEAVPPLTAAEQKAWRETVWKLATRQVRLLDKKQGAHHYWPGKKKGEPGRGYFLVGGETRKPKGLMVGLHGGGAGSGDAHSAHGAMDADARKMGWLAIYPEVLEKTEHGWTDAGTEEFVLDLLESALCTWKIDRDRVVFAGHSMGGYGTWTLGARHADLMAALAPSAGAPTPVLDRSGAVIDVEDGVVPNLRNVPIRIYQSDDDPNVPPVANRIAAKMLQQAQQRWGGFDFEYQEVSGRGHDLPPGGFVSLFTKIADRRRAVRPTTVVWQPTLPWKRQFYWLHQERPAAGAIVTASVDRPRNEVRVTCSKGPQSLAVLLDDDLLDLDREVAVFLGESCVFRGVPKRSLATVLLTGARRDPALTGAVRIVVAP
jgi:predicted esterase